MVNQSSILVPDRDVFFFFSYSSAALSDLRHMPSWTALYNGRASLCQVGLRDLSIGSMVTIAHRLIVSYLSLKTEAP